MASSVSAEASLEPSAGLKTDKVKLLYIGGEGRSGTTLIGRLLGEIEGFVNVGEMGYFWYKCFPSTNRCGCGAPFEACEFWSEVTRQAFGSFDKVDVESIRQTKRFLENIWLTPRLSMGWKSLGKRADVQAYLETLGALYKAIQRVSGAQVVVDGSKAPSYIFSLDQLEGVDLRVAHLVRDSRAVAYSWLRKKADPATGELMPIRPPARSALRWIVYNSLMHVGPELNPSLFVRYEDAVRDPEKALAKVASAVDSGRPSLSFLQGNAVRVGLQHTVNGNPDRFEQSIVLREDTEWSQKMKPGQRAIVTAITLPLLIRYGYMRQAKTALGK